MALVGNKSGGRRFQVAPPVQTAGTPLPAPLRHQMETALGADLSAVRVHEGHQATMVSALAYTTGNHIHFAPGLYDPYSRAGRELLGHEVAHVVQQRAGRVQASAGLVAIPELNEFPG